MKSIATAPNVRRAEARGHADHGRLVFSSLPLSLSLSLTLTLVLTLILTRPPRLRAADNPSGSAPAPTATPAPKRPEFVTTRDGTRLATDLYLPTHPGRFPTILLRTPYNKDVSANLGHDGAKRGYAVVIQDTRGRFGSTGENLPFHRDVEDGADTVRWITAQPWSDGRLGTSGGSAGAITQFQLALGGPRPLDAQFLVVGAPNIYDVAYTGGVFRKSLIEDWIRLTRFATNALPIWVAHPTYDAYWRARDASRRYRHIDAPAVHIGGWWDIFAQATIDAFDGYQTRGGTRARGHQKLVMGPWSHAVLVDKAGDLTFPNAKNPPGDTENSWRWFDRWLKGIDNGADRDPAVRYYVLGDVSDANAPGNTWRSADHWPPFAVQPTPFFLAADRTLSRQAPRERHVPPLTYTYDPANPVPTLGGIQLTLPAGPKDQRPIESRPDLLIFDSHPLPEPTEVTGRIRAKLWVSSDAPDTDFFVRLCDVYPDGRSYNLVEGMMRTRFRRGFHREHRLEPGRIVPLDIDLWSTSVIFNRGHRIRVHVTSSCAPGFDPNPNTGEPFRASDAQRPARNSIHIDARHPSRIELPIIPASAGERS